MTFIQAYNWEIFITLEVLSWISLMAFGLFRYFLDQKKRSMLFLGIFIGVIGVEALLGWLIYKETGELSTFQMVITIFVVYAITFGIADFKKLDRWMRSKIGKWRGIDLLTAKEKTIILRDKDPKYIARKYRMSSLIHLVIFVGVQVYFWTISLPSMEEVLPYIKDLSWIGTEDVSKTPYANETLYSISMVWGIVFVVDFIYSWSYTLFPSEKG